MSHLREIIQGLLPRRMPGSRLDSCINLGPDFRRDGNFWITLSLFILGILIASSSAHADTPITKNQAKKFYTDCAGNTTSLSALTPLQREYFCSCASVQMEKYMTVEDIQEFKNQSSPTGRAALIKMLERVQFPCITRPLADNVRDECVRRASANPQFAAGANKYCGCLADTMMNYVQKVGMSETLYRIQMTGELRDPMEALLSSSGYSNELIRNYYSCFGGTMP